VYASCSSMISLSNSDSTLLSAAGLESPSFSSCSLSYCVRKLEKKQ
jgi:hypothetical protein